jgi:hypothetical protein
VRILIGVLLLVLASACDHRPRVRAQKRNLVMLPLPWKRPSIHIAEDGMHVTYAVRDAGGYHVVTPAGPGEQYVDVSPPLFAPKSQRVFYWGKRNTDGGHAYDVVAEPTAFPTPFVEPLALVYSSGGAHWAALGAIDAPPGAEKDAPRPSAIMIDGRESGRWPAVTPPDFSPDGTHVAWLAREASGRVLVVVDGAVVRSFDAPPPAGDAPPFEKLAAARYLSDGRLLTLAPEGDGWSVYRDGERLVAYGHNLVPGMTILLAEPSTPASIIAGSIVTAAKAPVAVWWERMAGKPEQWRIVRDGEPVDGVVCDHYWDTQPPVLTADGLHVAYVCPMPIEASFPLGRRYVVLDGRRFGLYSESWTLGIADDGSQVAYGAAETLPIMTWRIFANGVPRTAPFELVWRPRFSPDATHVFWAAGPEHGRRRIGFEGRTITGFDDVMYGPEFPEPRRAVWVIRRGRKISRIEATF